MNRACDACGLLLDRGEHDYFIGAYTINLMAAELIVVAAILIGMVLSWPDVPWNLLMWGLLPLAVCTPLLTLPFARALWLAIDLKFQPPEPKDFASS